MQSHSNPQYPMKKAKYVVDQICIGLDKQAVNKVTISAISKLPNFPVYPKNDPLHLLAHQDQYHHHTLLQIRRFHHCNHPQIWCH